MNDTRTTVAGMWFTALLGFLILLTMLSEELLFFFGFIVVFSAAVVLFGWISKPSAYKRDDLNVVFSGGVVIFLSLVYLNVSEEKRLVVDERGSARWITPFLRSFVTPAKFYYGQSKIVSEKIEGFEAETRLHILDWQKDKLRAKQEGERLERLLSSPEMQKTLQENMSKKSGAERYADALERKAEAIRELERERVEVMNYLEFRGSEFNRLIVIRDAIEKKLKRS